MSKENQVATTRDFYDAAARKYVEFVGTDISAATESPIDRSILVAFIELIKRQAISRVVEVGCGPGRVAAFMADHGLDVIGVDVSRAMLGIARTADPQIGLFGNERGVALAIASTSHPPAPAASR